MDLTPSRAATNETSVLLLDFDGSAHRSLSLGVGKDQYQVEVADSFKAAMDLLGQRPFDVVIVGSTADKALQTEVTQSIRLNHLYTEIIVLAKSSDDKMAVQALQAGAFDCLCEPFSGERLVLTLRRAAEHGKMKKELISLRQDIAMGLSFDNLVGLSEKMVQLKETIGRIAPTDIPVLVTGGPGSGKGLLARVIHYHSNRRRGPFVRVDCSGFGEAHLETTLFGQAEDADTSAPRAISATLERADGGTLFLDGVDGMPLSVQSKLQCFLQDFKLKTTNSIFEKKIDLRTIAATERDLNALVAAGRFRKDLSNRLGVVTVKIPALAERIEDIEVLAEYFIREIASRSGKRKPEISRPAIDKLVRHTWPENVRELKSVLERAMVLYEGDHVDTHDIRFEISPRLQNDFRNPSGTLSLANADSLLENNQRTVIKKALIDNNWNFTHTAQALGIGRTTLWRKVKKYDLRRDTVSS